MENKLILFKAFLQKNLPIIILIILAIIVYHSWFSFNIFYAGDWGFDFSQIIKDKAVPSIWAGYDAFGGINLFAWRIPFDFVYGLFGTLGYNSNVAEKFLIFLPIVFLVPISSYLIIKKFTKTKLAVIGSIFFSYSTYFLASNSNGHEFITLAVPFGLLAFYFYLIGDESRKFPYYIISLVLLSVCGFIEFRVLYLICLLILAYLALRFLFLRNWKISVIYKTFSPYIFLIIALAFTLAFTIIFIFLIGSSAITDILARPLFGGQFFGIEYGLTTMHPFWSSTGPVWFVDQSIPFYFWLIPIIAFLSFLFIKKERDKKVQTNIIIFGIIALIGIFLTKQAGGPFEGAYAWMFKYLPGFNAFREATKFYIISGFALSVLITYTTSYIHKITSSKSRILSVIFVLFVSGLCIYSAMPLITGEIDSMFVGKSFNSDNLILKDLISSQQDYFRVMWVPAQYIAVPYSSLHPRMTLLELAQSNLGLAADFNAPTTPDEVLYTKYSFEKVFNQKYSDNILDYSSIKYVVVPVDETGKDSLFAYYGDRNYFVNNLRKIPYLTEINIGTKELIVFQNMNFKPHLYATESNQSLSHSLPIIDVNYAVVNPIEYKMKLTNVSKTVYLNFTEAYDSQWKLKIGGFDWTAPLVDKNYYLPDKFHYQNETTLNSFIIDPNYVKETLSKGSYTENPDGSIDLDITLYFNSQSYFYLGLIISGAALFICLFYLFYDWRRNRARIKQNNLENAGFDYWALALDGKWKNTTERIRRKISGNWILKEKKLRQKNK